MGRLRLQETWLRNEGKKGKEPEEVKSKEGFGFQMREPCKPVPTLGERARLEGKDENVAQK